MTDDEREAEMRRVYRLEQEGPIGFLLRRLDEARRPPSLAEIREHYRDAVFPTSLCGPRDYGRPEDVPLVGPYPDGSFRPADQPPPPREPSSNELRAAAAPAEQCERGG